MANRIGARRKRGSAESSMVSGNGNEGGSESDNSRPSLSRVRGAWQSEERICALIALLENGIPLRASCAALRIPETSLRDKMAVDDELRAWVEDARAAAEARHVQKVANADDWKASAWWLERTHADAWSPPKNRNEISGPDGAPVQLAAVDAVDRMSDAELTAAAKTLLGGGE